MSRFRRVRPGAVHGDEDECSSLDSVVGYEPTPDSLKPMTMVRLLRGLTGAEKLVAIAMANGITQADIAVRLGKSPRTVQNIVRKIRELLDPTPDWRAEVWTALFDIAHSDIELKPRFTTA